MSEILFQYTSGCSMAGCPGAPVARLVASWSYGPLRERKNYGLACERHLAPLLEAARARRAALAVGDDEQVGPVEPLPLAGVALAGRRTDHPDGMDPNA